MRLATTTEVGRLLAANLYRLRRRQGLTQAQAAARWGANRSSYAAWEETRRCPKVANLLAGCQFFGLPLHQLLTTTL